MSIVQQSWVVTAATGLAFLVLARLASACSRDEADFRGDARGGQLAADESGEWRAVHRRARARMEVRVVRAPAHTSIRSVRAAECARARPKHGLPALVSTPAYDMAI